MFFFHLSTYFHALYPPMYEAGESEKMNAGLRFIQVRDFILSKSRT